MAYEINDLKGFLFLVFAIPMVASTNIDCSGKPFHCVSSTHFMICVDLGGGVSTTIDDFVIPCPPTTVCHQDNIFECEFPKTRVTTLTLPFQVIGVTKQSVLSVTASDTSSVTFPTPPDESLNVLNEITTVINVPILEEVPSVQKTDYLEQPVVVINVTNATTSAQEIGNVKRTSNDTKSTIFTFDDIKKTGSISPDVEVTASLKDKSIETMTSATPIIEKISNHANSLVIIDFTPKIYSSLDISYNNNGSSVDLLINNVTVKADTNSTNTIADESNTTPVVFTNIWNGPDTITETENQNKTNLMNENFVENNATGDIPVIEHVVTENSVFISLIDQTSKNIVPLDFTDVFFNGSNNVESTTETTTNNTVAFFNTSYVNTATAVDLPNTVTPGVNDNILNEITTTPVLSKNNDQSLNYDNIDNENELLLPKFIVHTTSAEVGTTEKFTNFDPSAETIVVNPQRPTDTDINNYSFVENITDPPLEITVTTDLTVKFADNSYQVNRESSQSIIATKNANDTIEKIESIYNTSSTKMFDDITTELNKFLATTYPMTETVSIKDQNEAISYGIAVENEVSSVNTTYSVNEIPLNIYTTPIPYKATFNLIKNNTVQDRLLQYDNLPNTLTDTVLDIIPHNTSGNYTFKDPGTTEKSIITNRESNNQVNLNKLGIMEVIQSYEKDNIYILNKTVHQEIINESNTAQSHDVTKQNNLKNSIDTNNNVAINESVKLALPETYPPNIYSTEFTTNIPQTVYTSTISIDFATTIFEHNSEITDKSEPAIYSKDENYTKLPLDVTNNTKSIGEKKYLEDVLKKTTLGQDSVTPKLDTEQVNIKTDVIETPTYTYYSSVTQSKSINLNISNINNHLNVETTTITPTVHQNTVGTTKSIDIKNYTSALRADYKIESLPIVSEMETISSAGTLTSNKTLESSSTKKKSLLNSTQSSTTNISYSENYNVLTKLKDPSSTTLANNNPTFIQTSESVLKQSESVPKNTQTIENLSLKNLLNVELSKISTQTPLILNTKKNTASTEPSLTTISFTDRNEITNKMNYITEKNSSNFASSTVIPINNPSSKETKATMSINDVVIIDEINPELLNAKETMTKTVNFIPHIVSPQIIQHGVKTDLVEKQRLPTLTPMFETQTNKYVKSNPMLPALEPTRKKSSFSQVTMTPMAIHFSDVTETNLEIQDLSLSSTVNYETAQSTSDIITETVMNDVTNPVSIDIIDIIRENIDEETYNYNCKLNFSKHIFNKTSAENINITNHEKIVNETVFLKINENINYTKNDWMPAKVNIENTKQNAFKTHDSPTNEFEQEITSKSLDLKITEFQKNVLLTDLPIAAQVDQRNVKLTDVVKYELPVIVTSPPNVITIESVATNFSKHINTKNTDDTIKADTFLNSDIKNTISQEEIQNMSIKINNKEDNFTKLYGDLPSQNNTGNGSLKEHIVLSTNHTMTTEISSSFYKTDKPSKELKSSGGGTRNSNITTRSIKLNTISKHDIPINGSVSPFNCLNQTRGKHADKSDCRKFYTCVGKLNPIVGLCPNNTVFSEINKLCTRNLSHCVRNNQFRCLQEGRFSDFFQDSIYYICVKNSMNALVRYKLQCQNDYHLNKVSVKCEKNEVTTSQSVSSASENSKINNDELNTKIKIEETRQINNTTDFNCDSEGKFPFKNDCRKYYLCTNIKNTYRRRIKKCSSDEVFDSKKKKCVESDSVES